VTNNSTTEIEVQPQYLLDIKIGKSDGAHYRIPGTGFVSDWSKHTSTIPDIVIFSENRWEPPVFDAGTLTELKFDNAMPSWPSMLLIGDWEKLEVVPFVDPAMALPTDDIRDVSVAMHWNKARLVPNEIQEMAIFTYGPSAFIPSGVDVNAAADLRMWPNPVSSALHLDLDGKLQAQIQNVIGQTVWSGKVESETSIDVRSLEPGSYFLSVGQRVYPFVVVR
jgi:hypothetical protein